MALFRVLDIVERVQATRPNANVELIHKAYVFTAKVHHGQLRMSGDPYLIHPLNVAYSLADWNLDEETVATGLLHDTVEDTVATIEEIRDLFGDAVALLVDGVTKISRVTISDVAAQKAESLRKMILAMGKDLRVILVKLADRLHNLRTIEHLPPDKQISIARETVEIYAPIAARLGMSRIRGELEDRCFAVLHPAQYRELSQLAEERRRNTAGHIRDVIALLEEKCREAGIEATISGREKHLAGVYQKMNRQEIDFDHVYDFIGFRIITKTLRECYGALGIVHNLWKPVPGRFKDYIAMPKTNLYQSLHTTVFGPNSEMMEIQIRTEEMHALAENGVAAHWRYKEGRRTAEKEDQMFLWLRQILELQQDMKDPREFMDTVKVELFPEEVYVFTPRGDVKEIPRGGTPIDFAYAVHTEVGNQCVGAKVNGRMVPAEDAAQKRRCRRDHHPAVPQAQPRLAEDRQDQQGAHEDPGRSAPGADGAVAGSGAPDPREGAAEIFPEPGQGAQGGAVRPDPPGDALQGRGRLPSGAGIRSGVFHAAAAAARPAGAAPGEGREGVPPLLPHQEGRLPETERHQGQGNGRDLHPAGELLPSRAGRPDHRLHHSGEEG